VTASWNARRSQLTVFTGMNTLFNALLHTAGFLNRLRSLKVTFGVALPYIVRRGTVGRQGVALVEGYGLSENRPLCLIRRSPTQWNGTIGLPLPHTRCRCVTIPTKRSHWLSG